MSMSVRRKTLKRMLCGWFCVVLCAASGRTLAAPVFSTGFDVAEGFLPGPVGGQNGWRGDLANPNDSVVTVGPWFDVFGLQVIADGGFDGAFHLGAASPVFAAQNSGVTTVSQRIVRTGAGDADFLVQTVDTLAGQPVVWVQLTSGGDLLVNGALTGFQWQVDKALELSISHDWGSGQASVRVGDTWIATDLALSPGTAIDQLQYATDDSAPSASSSLLVDSILVLPEPSVAMLWAALTAMTLLRRR